MKSVRSSDIEIDRKKRKVFVGTHKKPTEKEQEYSNYTLRDRLLEWYCKNEPEGFDLFGKNWDRLFLKPNDPLSKFLISQGLMTY